MDNNYVSKPFWIGPQPQPVRLPPLPFNPAKQKWTLTLLPELWLTLLHRAEDHVSRRGGGESVQTRTGTVRLNDKEGLGAAVVRAVEDGTSGQTEGHAVLLAGGTDNCKSHSAGKSITSR